MLLLHRAWIATIGLAFLLLGLFGKDFRWGIRATGPAAPAWVGRVWFLALGLALIAAAFLLNMR